MNVTVEMHEAHALLHDHYTKSDCHSRLFMVDSGAGGTVISDPSVFTVIYPPSPDMSVQFGTGPKIPTKGVGTIVLHVQCRSTGIIHRVQLPNALYLPDQPLNILSVNDIRAQGGASLLDDNDAPSYVRWCNGSKNIFQTVTWKNRIPYIHSFHDTVPVSTIRRVLPPDLGNDVTHATFGHMGQAKLKQLVTEGFIDSSKLCTQNGHACMACESTNAKMDSYPGQHDLAATHVNHTLHTDLLHFQVTTADGYQYLLVVVDEFTRYAFVALLKKKSDAASNLLRIMKRAYVLHSTRVKNLRSDCGGEFQSTVMRLAKEELGIADEYVPANCHQSNGLVERLNYTIAGLVRVVLTQSMLPPTLWGEAALYAVHMYNLTPHSALIARNEHSAIPWKLYLRDSAERMERLYKQLVPFGIKCSIILTGDKPRDIKKLDPRSIPGLIVGHGPSTKQYRVMALRDDIPYRVYIVRHVIVNARHFQEYATRNETVPEVQRFAPIHCMTLLEAESVTGLDVPGELCSTPPHAVHVHEIALPTHALSRGSEHAGETEQTNVQDTSHATEEQVTSDQPPEVPFEGYETWSVSEVEPDVNDEALTPDDILQMNGHRAQWMRHCNALKVSYDRSKGCIVIATCMPSESSLHAEESMEEET